MNADQSSPAAASPVSGPSSTSPTKAIAIAIVALAVALSLVFCAVFAIVPSVPWWVGVPIGVVVAAVIVFIRLGRAVDIALAGLGAQPVGTDEYPRLHNLTQGLSLAGGVAEPELYVVRDQGRNAAAIAWGDRAAVVTSSGLLDSLDRIGLEGIIAEALVRIRSGDAEAATTGIALFGGLLGGPIAPLAKPVGAAWLRMILPDDRELSADRQAVALTRYPPGLHGAFTAIRDGSPRMEAATAANEHLWLVPPSSVGPPADDPNAAPLDLRIDVLGEL